MLLFEKLVKILLEEFKMPDDGYTDLQKQALFDHDSTNPTHTQDDVEEKVSQAFYYLVQYFPFFGQLAATFINPVYNEPSVGTMAVDQSGNLYINADFAAKLTIPQIAGVLAHELAHIGFNDLFAPHPGEDMKRWNVATDLVNNWYLLNDFQALNEHGAAFELPPGGLYPDADGYVRKVSNNLLGVHVDLPKEHWIDLNNADSREVFEILKRIDDEIIDAMNQQRQDDHIYQPSIDVNSYDIIPDPGGGGEDSEDPEGEKRVIDHDLTDVLVKIKDTDEWAVVIRDEQKDSVEIIKISEDVANEILGKPKAEPAIVPEAEPEPEPEPDVQPEPEAAPDPTSDDDVWASDWNAGPDEDFWRS
jgi:hypothetical protein